MTVDPTRMTRTVWSVVIRLPFPETGVNQDRSNRAVIYVTRPASQWAGSRFSLAGAEEDRTPDLVNAIHAFSLSASIYVIGTGSHA